MANKVKFGLRNVHIFPITSEDINKENTNTKEKTHGK
nr:MAG TPA: hypothetical protein [Caudoviricetes sp.]